MPLRRRAHGGNRLLDRNGEETEYADMNALRRSIAHVNNRYGRDVTEEETLIEKRWVKGSILNKEINAAFAQQDDDVQNGILSGLTTMVGKILPLGHQNPESPVQAKTKSRTARKSTGRYTGATGNARKATPLKDNVSGGQDLEFVCDISIGTPPQTFPIDPDTGSADLWVVDKSCQAANCGPDSRGKFAQKQSSTYAPIADAPQFDLQYAIGDVSGQYARETVSLAGVTVQKQTIGLANKTSPDWKDDLASGVLGLGFRAITSNNQRPFIQNLASQGGLKKKVISFAFGRYASGTQGKSEMMLGGSNKSLFKGKISYYDVSRVAYWQTGFKQFAAGSNDGVQNMDGIFDTGTSLIAAPSQQAAEFWKGVPNSQLSNDGTFYSYPCSQKINAKLTMPDGRSFTLNEKDLNFGKSPNDSSKCIGSVIVASTPGQIIFGLSALKNFYSVFDFGNNRIGFTEYSF
ncbi:hypothetical protein L7F22_003227 [Adiantum nelumboides]|nr:hypothetical protein [Adiantum nelumboides]